jgi:hypothetical protein
MSVTQNFIPDGASDEEIIFGELDVIREGGSSPYAGKSPPFRLNRQIIKNYTENAMKLGMRFAACYPYDWGSPRPLNRATMMDFPLLQYDMFDPGRITPNIATFSGYSYGARPADGAMPAKSPEQWRIISAQPITNLGRSICYPSLNLTALWPSISSTTPDHFTLARPFEVADRCRQFVFWAVDWQSYEDFETAPSAPVDASRYPKRSPHGANLSGNAAKPNIAMNSASFADRHQFSARNPEKSMAFTVPSENEPTGSDLPLGGNDSMGSPDKGNTPEAIAIFSGQYGADRNFNGTRTETNAAGEINVIYGKLDRGNVPKSVRMRAVLIGRFNYYDPRLPMVMR